MSQATPLDVFVRSTIARACELGRPDVAPDTPLLDLQIDSLRMVAIVSRVEQEFETRFSPDTILEFFMAEQVEDLIGLMRDSIARSR